MSKLFVVVLLLSIFEGKQASAQLDMVRLSKVDSLIDDAIQEKTIPGGVLAVVHKGELAYLKAYGNKSVYPTVEPMTENTVFDLASVTKPFTGIAVMVLLEQGRLRLEDAVASYLPYVPKDVKIIHLLTHTSGIADYKDLYKLLAVSKPQDRQALERYIVEKSGRSVVGTKFEYSCLNYVLLQFIVEKLSGVSLQTFEKEHIFKPLGMKHTDFNPKDEILELSAPTEKMPDGSVLRGVVHDSLAYFYNNGISGNAGLFSSAEDMVLLAKALLNDGALNGKRVLGVQTCRVMRTVPAGFEEFGRSLGWDNYSSYASDHGNIFDRIQTYGHTGYTGPHMVLDPTTETAIIFLAHRVHPNNAGSMVSLRAKLANIVAGSIVK